MAQPVCLLALVQRRVRRAAWGDLVVAGDCELALVPVPSPRTVADPATVAEFLAGTMEIPDEGLLDDHVVHTDGVGTWRPEELATITKAAPGDPQWLRFLAEDNARGN
ncbi:hypothetical protein [Amycolatopsis sp. NPDC004079]|uniref:hypothetical protein n=1 Tax=Amycolatopsis sp. NPDC004079 TaxID=3154549 RepID=UPI0033A2DE7E